MGKLWFILVGSFMIVNSGFAKTRTLNLTQSHYFVLDSSKEKGLKDYYKHYFPIGAAVSVRDLSGSESRLIVQQFNSLTAENSMKMGAIHPDQNHYHWEEADSIVNFAMRHHMKVRGHNLCWHAQVPRWLFQDSCGELVSKNLLLKRLKEHITSVVRRYKGKIYAWDVVNEAISDDRSDIYRNSLWFKICGRDYIAKAFEYAHEADPDAILFYNDYGTENPVKRQKIYIMIKELLAEGVPINGIGLQGHWSISNPSREELEKTITLFSSLGLQVQVTELDVSVYTGALEGRLKQGRKEQSAVFTPEMEQRQLEKYKMLFGVFRKNRNKITGITFWNVSDRYSWLDMRGRKNFPLLFDRDLKPKKAYKAVVGFEQ